MMRRLILVYILLLLPDICGARIITVDDDAPADFRSIQTAIDDATGGDTIIVGDGIYRGAANRDIVFLGKSVTLRSANGPWNCFIDCQGLGRGFLIGNDEGPDTVIDGFTILNGSADAGGGILCEASAPTILNCIIADNSAGNGGGVSIKDSPGATLKNCVLGWNLGTVGAGGIDCVNAAATIINCTITENSSAGDAGGISLTGGSNALITNSILWADSPKEIHTDATSSASITYSDIQGGRPGEGNIDTDPRFADKADGVTTEGLIAHWSFDEGEGAIAYDSAGGYDGTIYGAHWADGVIGGALKFDGGDGVYIEGSSGWGSELDIFHRDSDLSISAWVKLEGAGGTVVGRGEFLGAIAYQMHVSENKALLRTYDDRWYWGVYAYGVAFQNTWRHIVVVCDDRRRIGSIYVDWSVRAAERFSVFAHGVSNDACTKIGCIYDYDDSSFDGVIDDVRIYDRALSVEEIGQLNRAVGVYCLRSGSPCIDGGDPNYPAYPGQNDIDGNSRVIGGVVDMGACEAYAILSVEPLELEFGAYRGRPNPPDQTFKIGNEGPGLLNWEITTDCNWLTVSPRTGSSYGEMDEVILSADVTGMEAGEHECELVVSDPKAKNSPQILLVRFMVNDVITVSPNGTADFATIQEGIDAAKNRDIVEVRPGRYMGPGNRDIDFRGKAITVRSENGPENCIIDCEGTEAEPHRGFDFHSGEGADSILEGLTITNGYADGSGGGICCVEDSSPTIENCLVSNNTASGGGGIFCEDGSTVIRGCTVMGNSAGSGGGIRSGEHADTKITGCIISDNIAGGGGGISCGGRYYQDGAVITNCIINNNGAEYGGAISSSRARIDVNNCIITDNTATSSGGAISCGQSSPTLVNCTIARNLAGSYGGVVSGGGYGRASFFNCILRGNRAEKGNMAATGGCPSHVGCTDMHFSYSCIQSGSNAVWVDGYYEMELGDNISADPRFADPNNGDFRLKPDSPCIDAGENELPDGLPESDIEGGDRVQDGDRDGLAVVDMGAYEARPIDELVIWPSAAAIDFFVEEGGGAQTQTLEIRERGGRTLHWTVISNGSWLRVTPTSGISTEAPGEVTVAVDANGLGVGTYNSSLVISDPNAVNSPVIVRVALHVLGDTVHVPGQFSTIQDGIDHAAEGGSVVIADGFYKGPGNRDIDFRGKAITVRSENGPDACVIDCDGTDAEPHRGFKFHSGESQSSILDGITIVDANGHSYSYAGGAIYCEQSSPTINNCRITDCRIGGIACLKSDPNILNCTISRNGQWGIWCELSSPLIDNCIIEGVDVGIYGSYQCLPVIRNCTIRNNLRTGVRFSYGGSPKILNSVICNNGGEYSWDGGGIYIDNRTGIPAEIRNCTISGNTASRGGGIYLDRGDLVVTNSIVWGNIPDQMYGNNEGFFVTYCNIEGGWRGANIIDADPCFIEPDLLDYRLTADSPCIDIGDPNSTASDDETDIDGDPRIIGGYIDLGADEFAPRPIIRIVPREVNFAAEYNGDNPEHQIVNIDNTGVGTLKWKIVEDCPWLEVEPTQGESVDQAEQVSLTVDVAGLAIGAHDCILTVVDPCATNNPQTIRVILDIFGDTVYVPAEMPTIQDAIDYVLPSGTVIVADGTYTGP
ncbi:MAG: right-handed parallel beta-helix repeat-containing protein, partial [Planctomycetota bacterium]